MNRFLTVVFQLGIGIIVITVDLPDRIKIKTGKGGLLFHLFSSTFCGSIRVTAAYTFYSGIQIVAIENPIVLPCSHNPPSSYMPRIIATGDCAKIRMGKS